VNDIQRLPRELRTAIVLLLDEVAPEVAAARYEIGRFGPNEVELHVTLLFPFVARSSLDASALEELRAFFAVRPAPAFALARVETFDDGVVYAAPEPAGPLTTLIVRSTADGISPCLGDIAPRAGDARVVEAVFLIS
jgi:hypothetical protein